MFLFHPRVTFFLAVIPKLNSHMHIHDYNIHYDNLPYFVHGGLTFNGMANISNPEKESETHSVYVIGFDTAHHGDYLPKYPDLFGSVYDYKTHSYVLNEIYQLIDQIVERDINETVKSNCEN